MTAQTPQESRRDALLLDGEALHGAADHLGVVGEDPTHQLPAGLRQLRVADAAVLRGDAPLDVEMVLEFFWESV